MISVDPITGVVSNLSPLTEVVRGAVSTTDAVPTTLFLLTPDDNTAGIIEVWAAGSDGENNVASVQVAAFKKMSVTVSLQGLTQVLPLVATQGEAVTLAAIDDVLRVQVTGAANKAFEWMGEYKILFTCKEYVAP